MVCWIKRLGLEGTFLEWVEKRIKMGSGTIVYDEGGNGPNAVVLHGMAGRRQGREFLGELGKHFHVISPDLPGFGESLRDPEVESTRDCVYVLLDFLNAVGVHQPLLIGESVGGWVAAELAVDYWRDLAALALLSPLGVHVPGIFMPDIFRMRARDFSGFIVQNPEKAQQLADLWDGEGLAAYLSDREMLARLAWNPRMHNPRLLSRLSRIQVPALCLWGAEDQLLSNAYRDAFAPRLPDVRSEVLSPAGHALSLDQPRESAARLQRFFAAAIPTRR